MASVENEAFLQALLLETEEDEAEEQLEELALALGATLLYGAEESRRLRSERRRERRLYLVRRDLLPNPRAATPWQKLYAGENNRAYITTMAVDVPTFQFILKQGFEEQWNTTPIPRNDVSPTADPTPYRRSLDAAGALGLILHY
ncbi:hypothetical protein BDN70DRAFT_884771 [Pholiota conissans]|uniref:Uncharacterized protein n=1 Tax=Pholiota conissans TaxID=109636 RepID=A0A9P5YRC3_9AGAR|nr:hypothetical protein BDN70DRAFT_884771 [Pholiota conissans]